MNTDRNLRMTARAYGAPKDIPNRALVQFVANAMLERVHRRHRIAMPPSKRARQLMQVAIEQGAHASLLRGIVEATARACLGTPKPHLRRVNGVWIQTTRPPAPAREEIAA